MEIYPSKLRGSGLKNFLRLLGVISLAQQVGRPCLSTWGRTAPTSLESRSSAAINGSNAMNETALILLGGFALYSPLLDA
jgi:hypothetical protein